MVVDTPALIACLNAEPEAERIAATLVEAGIVAERQNEESGGHDLDLLLHRLRVEVVPVTEEQAELARSATGASARDSIPPS